MTESEMFMEELLEDAEDKEEQQTEAYFDLLLLQIKQMQEQMARNFAEAEKEVKIINQWALNKNHALQVKIDLIEKRLEIFIRERKQKTIDLAHGVLKLHKKADKLEISNMDLFLKHANAEMLTIVPEQVKADLTKIKAFVKTHQIPKGITVIAGREEFSYKLNETKEVENGQEEIRVGAEQTNKLRAVI